MSKEQIELERKANALKDLATKHMAGMDMGVRHAASPTLAYSLMHACRSPPVFGPRRVGSARSAF